MPEEMGYAGETQWIALVDAIAFIFEKEYYALVCVGYWSRSKLCALVRSWHVDPADGPFVGVLEDDEPFR